MTEESLFQKALAQPPEKRGPFLEQACAGRADLRAAVEALLAAHEKPRNVLDKPLPELYATGDSDVGQAGPVPAGESQRESDDAPPAAQHTAATCDFQRDAHPGSVIAGRYILQESIGEGGMGEVWVARQSEPVKRKVAIKLIKIGMDSRAVLQRFEQERQALAMMDHPNIARVLDGGMTPTGQPFFVMELVNGLPLNKFCDEAKLTPRERLELFVPICQAIQHAHHKGIVHRDLKPANILVTLIDGRPVPKVIDFGVAKATAGKLTEETMSTSFGAVVGTLEYMSPEQTGLMNVDIDTRADIYSLGVILYELLTGLRPFAAKRLKDAAMTEMIRVIREQEPSKPSTRLSTDESLPSLAALRHIEPRRLMALLRGDLDWVVMKCLEKQRERRYETANGLARDIVRYLNGDTVEACPPSMGYRVRKFVRRHRGQVLAASVVLFALLAGMIGTTWGLFEARRQERIARGETAQKELARAAEAERVQERDLAVQREAERADELKHRLGVSEIVLASAAYDNRDVLLAAERLDKVPVEQRGWDWRYLKQQTRGGLFTLIEHKRPVYCVTFSPDGKRIVTAAWNEHEPCEVKVWDLEKGGIVQLELKEIPSQFGINSRNSTVAFSLDGARIVTGGENKTARVCDAQTGTVLLELMGHSHPVMCASFSPDGTRIVSGSESPPRILEPDGTISGVDGPGEVKVWDATTGRVLLDLVGHTGNVTSVAFSPDGTRIVSGGGDVFKPGEVKVWDAEQGGKALLDLNGITSGTSTVSFSPDGTRIVTGRRDGTATVVDARTGEVRLELKGRARPTQIKQISSIWMGIGVLSASFSPDGSRILTTGGFLGAGEATVWDARTGAELLELKGHTNLVLSASFSPDGTRIITGSADGTVKLWDTRTGSGRYELGEQRDEVSSVAFSPDGKRVATGSVDGTTTVWDVRTGGAPRELKGSKGPVRSVSFSPDGTRLVTAGGGGDKPGHATVWEVATGRNVLELMGLQEGVLSAAYSPDGRRIVTGGNQEDWGSGGTELKVWDAQTGETLLDLTEPPPEGYNPTAQGCQVAFSPDGTRIVTAGGRNQQSWSDRVTVRDSQTGNVLLDWQGSESAILSVAYSPDGKRILTGDAEKSVKVWDGETGVPLLELKGHLGGVLTAAFNPDGTRIVTGSFDKTAKVWDVRTGTALVELKGNRGAVQSLAFSPDGTQIVTGGGDFGEPGEAYVWEARTGKELPDEEE